MGGSHESVRLIGIQMIQVGTGVGARTYKRNGKKKKNGRCDGMEDGMGTRVRECFVLF